MQKSRGDQTIKNKQCFETNAFTPEKRNFRKEDTDLIICIKVCDKHGFPFPLQREITVGLPEVGLPEVS